MLNLKIYSAEEICDEIMVVYRNDIPLHDTVMKGKMNFKTGQLDTSQTMQEVEDHHSRMMLSQ